MQKTITVSFGLFLFFGAAQLANAGDFDGSKTLLCAPGDARECSTDGSCSHVSVDSINIPRFITIDVKNKKLSGVDADGEDETTAIQNIRLGDDKMILQGAENNRGWSIVIDQESGRMSATVSDNQVGFVVFGACIVR